MGDNSRFVLSGLVFAAAGFVAWENRHALFEGPLLFEPFDDPAESRKFERGNHTTAFEPFTGLSSRELDPCETIAEARALADICSALYRRETDAADVVLVASFTDYFRPFCCIQTQNFAKFKKTIRRWRKGDLARTPPSPGGLRSGCESRAGTKRLGACVAFRNRLMKSTFRATPEYLRLLSGNIGIGHVQQEYQGRSI